MRILEGVFVSGAAQKKKAEQERDGQTKADGRRNRFTDKRTGTQTENDKQGDKVRAKVSAELPEYVGQADGQAHRRSEAVHCGIERPTD